MDTKKAWFGSKFSGTVQKRLENSNMVDPLRADLIFPSKKVRRKTLTGSVQIDFENPEQSQSLPSSARLRLPFLMAIVSIPLKIVSIWRNIGKTPIPPITLS